MKLNLKRIQELEAEYNGKQISLNTLEIMVNSVMFPKKDPMGWNNTSTYDLAFNTLKDLGVIEEPIGKKGSQQLNSWKK